MNTFIDSEMPDTVCGDLRRIEQVALEDPSGRRVAAAAQALHRVAMHMKAACTETTGRAAAERARTLCDGFAAAARIVERCSTLR